VDCLQNSIQIFIHLVVPETEDPEPMLPQPMVSGDIRQWILGVLAAIHLDHQPV